MKPGLSAGWYVRWSKLVSDEGTCVVLNQIGPVERHVAEQWAAIPMKTTDGETIPGEMYKARIHVPLEFQLLPPVPSEGTGK